MAIFSLPLIVVVFIAMMRGFKLRDKAGTLEFKAEVKAAQDLGYGAPEKAVSIAAQGDQTRAEVRDRCASLRRNSRWLFLLAAVAMTTIIVGWAIRIWA